MSGPDRLRGIDGVASVIDQLAGIPAARVGVSRWSLPSRVTDYSPTMLDELLPSGEVVWAGHGRIGGADGLISLHPADIAPVTPAPPTDIDTTAVHDRLCEIRRRAAHSASGSSPSISIQSESETETAPGIWCGPVDQQRFVRPGPGAVVPRAGPPAARRNTGAPWLGPRTAPTSSRLSTRYLGEQSLSRPASPTAGGPLVPGGAIPPPRQQTAL